tara:strand:+ start:6494 stop:7336 length:843 start_codon:yes stop_codon:yes gene_type:complete
MSIKFISKFFKFFILKINRASFVKGLKKFRDIHKGEECYIFGDGSSLRYFDLNQFADKISIASNNLIFHSDFKKLNVKYYCIYEPYWFTPFFLSGFSKEQPFKFRINKIQKFQKRAFRKNPKMNVFTDISNYFGLKGKNIIYFEKEIFKEIIKDNQICQIDDPFNGSLRVQILMAIFMGFKKIYLVGHDYTHENSYSSHFYENGINRKKIKNNQSWNYHFFEIVKKFIEINNITLNGGSSHFKSISYQKFSGEKLKPKTNEMIVAKKNRKILSNWPYYKI